MTIGLRRTASISATSNRSGVGSFCRLFSSSIKHSFTFSSIINTVVYYTIVFSCNYNILTPRIIYAHHSTKIGPCHRSIIYYTHSLSLKKIRKTLIYVVRFLVANDRAKVVQNFSDPVLLQIPASLLLLRYCIYKFNIRLYYNEINEYREARKN